MELITHNLIGVIIQILCFRFLLFPLNIVCTILFAHLSHLFFDAISIITYHTPDKQKGDKFWIIWHYIIYLLSIISFFIFMIPYWLGMLFANIIDIWDWFILRPIQKRIRKKSPESKWGDKYYLHWTVDWVRDKLFFWLPVRNYKKSGILIEIFIIIILSVILGFLGPSLFIT